MLNGLLKKFIVGNRNSKNVAKKRLQFALMCDKLDVSDTTLANLQRDIVDVISRYFVIDSNAIKLDVHRTEGVSALILKTPLLGGKHTIA